MAYTNSLSPISAAIENENFGITSLLLSKGANPNGMIPSSSTPKSFIDYAISKQNERLIVLLVACGCNIDQSTLKSFPNYKTKYAQYFVSTKTETFEDLSDKLKEIRNKLQEEEEKSKNTLNELHNVSCMKRAKFAPCINLIRHEYLDILNIVNDIQEIGNQMNNKRLELLNERFKYFASDDLAELKKQIENDNNSWSKLLRGTIHKLEKNASDSTISAISEGLKSQVDDMQRKRKNILNQFSEIDVLPTPEKTLFARIRNQLNIINKSYDQLGEIVSKTVQDINNFHQNSQKFVEKVRYNLTHSLEAIKEIENSHTALERIGFNENMIDMLDKNNESKEKYLSQTIEQLQEQIILFNELSAKLVTVLNKFIY